jgi:hypothetical protein
VTPPALDWRSVERKLTRIRLLVDQLATLGPFDGQRFANEPIAGLAAERLLVPAAGLRNVLVHAYLDDRVAEATRSAPEQFAEYVRQASRWFAERSGAV